MLGDKGVGVAMTSSVWVPRGLGYRSCSSKRASEHQREPVHHGHKGKSEVFSAEAAKTGLYTQASQLRVRREGDIGGEKTDGVRS